MFRKLGLEFLEAARVFFFEHQARRAAGIDIGHLVHALRTDARGGGINLGPELVALAGRGAIANAGGDQAAGQLRVTTSLLSGRSFAVPLRCST